MTITGNTIVKRNPYVSAIDAEPSASPLATVWNVTITDNTFDAEAIAVMLWNMPGHVPPGGVGGNFAISGNRGRAARFYHQENGGSAWVNVNRRDNF